ncbi:MAG: polynucleotide adenylyltransferase PcnB [Pseudomonadota bacterium]|nr:polynucleotide adenylyltransferase PcnB [Pseudomonadota bacterium]
MPRRIASHKIPIDRVSRSAIRVVESLRKAHYETYLVGGCVRDLLLGLVPKDFDVATSATPEEVRKVFPRARLIGRRFRIVHVRMGREIIEVSTFRKQIDHDTASNHGEHEARNGLIVRDNVYGNIDEDAFRRDFTVNALYYDPANNTVLDFVKGMQDLGSRTLRLIGNPKVRYQEDPVRMLRAIRLAAKLDFSIEKNTERAISPTGESLSAVPPPRLFDEFNKLLMTGAAERAFELLQKFNLLEILFPLSSKSTELVTMALQSTDQRIALQKPVTPAFVLAALLWNQYKSQCDASSTVGNPQETHFQAARNVIQQQNTIAIPKRHAFFIRDVWHLQLRLERRNPRSIGPMLEHRRFRAAYDFLVLRAGNAEVEPGLATWWTEIQTLNSTEQQDRISDLSPQRKRRRRRSKRDNT